MSFRPSSENKSNSTSDLLGSVSLKKQRWENLLGGFRGHWAWGIPLTFSQSSRLLIRGPFVRKYWLLRDNIVKLPLQIESLVAQGKGTFHAAGCPGSPPVAGISLHKETANLSNTPISPAHGTMVHNHLSQRIETRCSIVLNSSCLNKHVLWVLPGLALT